VGDRFYLEKIQWWWKSFVKASMYYVCSFFLLYKINQINK